METFAIIMALLLGIGMIFFIFIPVIRDNREMKELEEKQ